MQTCPKCGDILYPGAWPICQDASGKHGHTRPRWSSRISAIHSSERAVIYRNPRTGEIRRPARSDQPVPEVYARQGYQRVELDTPQAVADHERETGRVHERSWYDPGSATAEREMVAALEAPLPISGLDG